MFFPTMFDNILQQQNFGLRKKRIMAMCDVFISDDKEKAIKDLFEIEIDILKMRNTKNFSGVESYEIQFEKSYQTIVCSLSNHTNKDVGKMNVIEVYTLMEMLNKDNHTNELNG